MVIQMTMMRFHTRAAANDHTPATSFATTSASTVTVPSHNLPTPGAARVKKHRSPS